MILDGYIKDKKNLPIQDAIIEVKNNNFITIFSTSSDENGYYKLDIPSGTYPFLTAVKDYAVNNLEYWCHNLCIDENLTLNICFDKLEIYGLHVFNIPGGWNSLMVYFRPMSLVEYQKGSTDISPKDIDIKITIDNKEKRIVSTNLIKEFIGDRYLSAYLLQIEFLEKPIVWKKLDIQINDKDNNYGWASIFNSI